MRHAVGIFLRKISQRLQLFWRDTAKRNFDAHHPWRIPKRVGSFYSLRRKLELLHALAIMPLPIVVTLSVDAAPQSCLRKDLLVDLPLFAKLHLLLEDVDLPSQVHGYLFTEPFFPAKNSF